jgi:hypothetical protein
MTKMPQSILEYADCNRRFRFGEPSTNSKEGRLATLLLFRGEAGRGFRSKKDDPA